MTIKSVSSKREHQEKLDIERPLAHEFAPHALTDEKLMMIPLMPSHQSELYVNIFSQPKVMQYFGAGKSFTIDEFTQIHMARVNQNLMPKYDDKTGQLFQFTWTILTAEGIAGHLNIFQTEGKTEIAFSVSPTQQGRGLASRSSELLVEYLGEEASFIATAHPKNVASLKTLERIHYPDGRFVFFSDPQRQNVTKYGPNQPRNYFLSKKQTQVSFFSFYKRKEVHIDISSNESQDEATNSIPLNS